MAHDSPLNAKQQRFVDEYLIDLNATQAAVRAGYSPKTARSVAAENLTKPNIQAAVEKARQAQSERTKLTADDILRMYHAIATADPNELVEYRRVCCRYCYGNEHNYQSTLNEMRRDRAAWEAKQAKNSKEVFDERGGDGYDAKKPPNPSCPECFGEGDGRAHFKDTRNLSATAKRLYLGVKITKGGIEVSMLNPMDALDRLSKHLGLYDAEKGDTPDSEDQARALRDALRAMRAADGLPTAG